jgi:hypothetical protein
MLHLICTVEHGRIDWLPQFVEHYRGLSVERFHLTLHFEPDVPREVMALRTRLAEETLSALGIGLHAVLIWPYDSDTLRDHHDQVQSQIAAAGDWIVWADLDEFQVYPEPLTELIAQAERDGYDYFRAVMIDRVAEDGSLPAFDPDQPIWEQYPRRCHLTRDVAGAWDIKATCARGEVIMKGGNHDPVDGWPAEAWPALFEVHHFKWDASVVPRLQRRLQPDWKERCYWWTESAALLDHIERNGGRVDPALLEAESIGRRACASPK